MQELIKAVKKRMSELSNLGEENIKNHVVVHVFLKELGYDPDNWDYEEAILAIQGRYGKNALLKGTNYMDGATTRERNNQVGGHKG